MRADLIARNVSLALFLSCSTTLAQHANPPGVSDSEIKIGQTMPYTGPAAAFSAPGLAETAYLKMINDQGGVARST